MNKFDCVTRGDAIPNGKPKIFLTCHPNDLSRVLSETINDILGAVDCAVFYTKDMQSSISDEELENGLKEMNLFVVPISNQLLSTTNRTLTADIPYALKEHIPILPIMIEHGLIFYVFIFFLFARIK